MKLLLCLALLAALAVSASANDLGELIASLDPTVGLVADRDTGLTSLGVAAHFRVDSDGDLARWLTTAGLEAWSSGKTTLQILAVPTVVAGHFVGHLEATAFAATDIGGEASTGLKWGLGYQVGPSAQKLHVAVGWELGGGKPCYFAGIKVLK